MRAAWPVAGGANEEGGRAGCAPCAVGCGAGQCFAAVGRWGLIRRMRGAPGRESPGDAGSAHGADEGSGELRLR